MEVMKNTVRKVKNTVKRSKQLKMDVKCGYEAEINLKMPGVEKIKEKKCK